MFVVDNKLFVYYDCLDGGLFIIIVEMVFVGYMGVIVDFVGFIGLDIEVFYNEELGVVI